MWIPTLKERSEKNKHIFLETEEEKEDVLFV